MGSNVCVCGRVCMRVYACVCVVLVIKKRLV